MQQAARKRYGFTLIELSIVMVIIALIVSGVILGKDMIQQANTRSLISQLNRYSAAANTFRTKYEYLPGDVPGQKTASLGLFSYGMLGGVGEGDGNGLINSWKVDSGHTYLVGEPFAFWRHLSDAGLSDKAYGAAMDYRGNIPASKMASEMGEWFPTTKAGRLNFLVVQSISGFNYFRTTSFNNGVGGGYALNTGGGYDDAAGLSPLTALALDTKLDDGLPLTGRVLAMKANDYMEMLSAAGDGCSLAGTPVTYNVAPANADQIQCSVAMRFQ